MKKMMAILAVALMCSVDASAQGFLKKLGEKAKEKVEKALEKKADDVIDGKKSKKSSNDKSEAVDDTPVDAKNQKSDFVRGSVILFEDDFANEQMGEFPSKWDISDGSLEVAYFRNYCFLSSDGEHAVLSARCLHPRVGGVYVQAR